MPRINKIDENKRFIRVHKKQLPMRKLWRPRRMSFIFIRVLYLFREKENIYIYIDTQNSVVFYFVLIFMNKINWF